MALWDRNMNLQGLRVIKTARDEFSINEAVKSGFKPLIKKVVPSDKICSKYAVIQNRKTGEVHVISDYRSNPNSDHNSDFEIVIACSPYVALEVYEKIAKGRATLVVNQTYDVLNVANAAFVTSGTATLETAL